MPPSAPSSLTDKNAPSFDSTAMDGREIRDIRLRGKIVIITFFSKDCLACERWTPEIEMISRESADIAAVGVSQDASEEDLRGLLTTWRITYPVVFDKDRKMTGRFVVGELPTTLVVDPAGVVRWVGGPAQTEADLRSAIQVIRERQR